MAINYLTIIVSFFMLLMMVGASSLVAQTTNQENIQTGGAEQQNKYLGMWVTADGHIRQELLPGGRYNEARGTKQGAYTGRYEMAGTHVKYWDDTGFTATGDFSGNDTLYHGGYIFYRESKNKVAAF